MWTTLRAIWKVGRTLVRSVASAAELALVGAVDDAEVARGARRDGEAVVPGGVGDGDAEEFAAGVGDDVGEDAERSAGDALGDGAQVAAEGRAVPLRHHFAAGAAEAGAEV